MKFKIKSFLFFSFSPFHGFSAPAAFSRRHYDPEHSAQACWEVHVRRADEGGQRVYRHGRGGQRWVVLRICCFCSAQVSEYVFEAIRPDFVCVGWMTIPVSQQQSSQQLRLNQAPVKNQTLSRSLTSTSCSGLQRCTVTQVYSLFMSLSSLPLLSSCVRDLPFRPGPPGPPGDCRVTEVTETTASVSWSPGTDNYSPILSYAIQARTPFFLGWQAVTTGRLVFTLQRFRGRVWI